ncbi:hypothetical protein [Algihabitans albus]|uniref:hypothetical protein n=1 Tax=Algihabitans albus TaxID=2164067 RepID=UPI000E5D2BDF|nr:hypothetical protein [Algihabitans albus]
MVAYGFKRFFGEPIRWGLKSYTLRAPRAGRSRHARPKEKLQLYTSLRTKHARKILDYDPVCRLVLPCSLRFERPYRLVEVRVDGKPVDPDFFAARDGFAFVQSRAKGAWFEDGKARWIEEPPAAVMGCFWRHEHPAAFEAGTFEGELIVWRQPRTITSAADYEGRYGAPIDAELQRSLIARIDQPVKGPVKALPPDFPDLGVG